MNAQEIEQRLKQIAGDSTVLVQYWPDTGQWAVARSAHNGNSIGWAMVGKPAASLEAALTQ